MKLLIASNNKHKIREINEILKDKFEEILCLSQAGINCDPEETGSTFEENATIKATEISKFTKLCVLADDTGLCVNALNGAPGVNSARYAGNHDDKANRKKLLQELNEVSDRTAHFETCMVLLFPNGKKIVANGIVNGEILQEERGENGFGYDSLFFSYELNKTFGEATDHEKNLVSHRARALHNLLKQL